MVERKQAEITEFIGVVEKCEIETNELKDKVQHQYHIFIKPENIEIKGKSGFMHEWIRIPGTSDESHIPEGSVLDKFVTELEIIDKTVKNIKTVPEVFKSIIGKKYKFVHKKLGKSFNGNEAKLYWVPITQID